MVVFSSAITTNPGTDNNSILLVLDAAIIIIYLLNDNVRESTRSSIQTASLLLVKESSWYCRRYREINPKS